MKIAILGFGTVGSGAYEIGKNAGIEVVRILARHGRPGYEHLNEIITPNIEDITQDPQIELVVESMGGIEPAREYVLACLNAGKHVVTPNKNLISACYTELREAAIRNNVQLRFTATVGGGIPWLFNLQRTKRCDYIESIRGIVNGTCNFILDAMYQDGKDFGEMLAIAQELGYAEADPSADIEGTDTLRKTVISTNLAFDVAVSESEIPCYGIDTITASDVAYLKSQGLVCKLMMNAKRDGDSIVAYVEPTAFPITSLEANVETNNNLITLTGRGIGTQSFFGQGAGMLPTGESVIQDVIDIRDGIAMSHAKADDAIASNQAKSLKIDNDKASHSYYVRDGKECYIAEDASVTKMHEMGRCAKEEGRSFFFAGIAE